MSIGLSDPVPDFASMSASVFHTSLISPDDRMAGTEIKP
jgi:hypothetical protein